MATPTLLSGVAWAVLGAGLAGLFQPSPRAAPEPPRAVPLQAAEPVTLSQLKSQLAEQLFCPPAVCPECFEEPCVPPPAASWWALLFLTGVACGLLAAFCCCSAAAAGSWFWPRAVRDRQRFHPVEHRAVQW